MLNTNESLLINTNLKKLKILLLELEDLMPENDIHSLLEELQIDSLSSIINLPINKIRFILNSPLFEKKIKHFKLNPNKWIRLRESNDDIELTTKHIFTKNDNNIQKVLEVEIKVSSFDKTNIFLESIGLAKRSYQEKIRYSYEYKGAMLEIDIWPMLNPYLEIEADNYKLIEDIIEDLDLNKYQIVSLNTEQLYKNINIDVHSISELKFD
ncbi:hypothetical protein CIW83_05995 [Tissierella sp. P1]|uniref:hypothetical protein n=1 Tax=Tissierella sp. P1 TaxID=1280483 RepID=UPI000BA12559|nr:hypothetical protein [Tissierella sp. P1]OZV13082.1 hypothetical protein CIW83_05995 [Tissierella sp. P1]